MHCKDLCQYLHSLFLIYMWNSAKVPLLTHKKETFEKCTYLRYGKNYNSTFALQQMFKIAFSFHAEIQFLRCWKSLFEITPSLHDQWQLWPENRRETCRRHEIKCTGIMAFQGLCSMTHKDSSNVIGFTVVRAMIFLIWTVNQLNRSVNRSKNEKMLAPRLCNVITRCTQLQRVGTHNCNEFIATIVYVTNIPFE